MDEFQDLAIPIPLYDFDEQLVEELEDDADEFFGPIYDLDEQFAEGFKEADPALVFVQDNCDDTLEGLRHWQNAEFEVCVPEADVDGGVVGDSICPEQDDSELEICYDTADEENEDDQDPWKAMFSVLKEFAIEVREEHSRLTFRESIWQFMSKEERLHVVVSRIEDIITKQLECFRSKNLSEAFFVYPDHERWDSIVCDPDYGILPNEKNPKFVKTLYTNSGSRSKYTAIMTVLQKVLELYKKDTFSTKRDIYYENNTIFRSQSTIDSAVTAVTSMLRIPRLQLRLLSTSKGLVAGSLAYTSSNGIHRDLAESVNGDSVPQVIEGVTSIVSNARFILVVEKDATFQKLLDDGFLHHSYPVIMITGKGVPDLNTRQFLHLLWKTLAIPVFALVDCNPFGVEIMCTYKFGSLAMAWSCEQTAVTKLRWLGVHPSDLNRVKDKSCLSELTEIDRKKLESLLKRPFLQHCPALQDQLNHMKRTNLKGEIQIFSSPNVLVRDKIVSKDWV